MDDLVDYLRSRHVPDEDIQRMEEDKIDQSVIKLMTDEDLKDYLPSYGDRVAVFGFCRRKEPEPSSRKSKLFDRLKGKLNNRNSKDNMTNKEHTNSNAKKTERKVFQLERGN